ncbi:hypothetical protein DXG01_016220 [Tephrocybe rancida]|nr:hypothetical protein DXG01_016220 [Tephrocybe rancida]
MLLLPCSYDQSAGKSAILESWIQFGSVTCPLWMVAVDDALWKALLTATQGGDVVSHIGDAIATLQPYVSSSTPVWFALVSNKTPCNLPSTLRIEDVDPDNGCNASKSPIDTSLSLIGSGDPHLSSAVTPTQDPPGAACSGATPLNLSTPLPSTPTPSSDTLSTSADPPVVPTASTAILQPVHCVPSHSLEMPSQDVVKDSGNANTRALPDTELQPNMSPVLPPQLPPPAEIDTTKLSTPPSPNHEYTGSDASSDLSDTPESPPASIDGAKKALEQPATRRSSRVPINKPAIPYPASSGNPHKCKKHVALPVEQEQAPAPPAAPRNPYFIDLTLEDSDNKVKDSALTLDKTVDFAYGDVEVSYPINSQSPTFTWLPKFHLAADLKWFYSLDDAMKRSAPNGRASPIEYINCGAYDIADPAAFMDLIKTKVCIHVAAGKHTDTGFTEETFNEICNLEEVTMLHDFTVKDGVRTRKGTIMDLLAASTMKPLVAVSALHIPSAYDMFTKLPFASDWYIWLKVQGKAYCHVNKLYPVPEMCWAIASMGSAHHYWQFDANGLGTFLRVETGVKLWFIAVPKNRDFQMFMRPDVMTSFKLDESNEHLAITGLKAMQSIFCSFLAHHARLLIHYKRLAIFAKVDGFCKSMTLGDVTAAVSDCVRGGPAWLMFLADNTPHTRGTFAWHNPAYTIQHSSAAVSYDFPHLHGYVFGDIKAAASLRYNILQTVIDTLVTYIVEDRTTSDDEGEAKDPVTRRRLKKRACPVPLTIKAA